MTDVRHALKISVTGRVQGVGFRDWTRREAADLKLDGWVRNEVDDSVTVVVAGSRGKVELLVALLHKGPRSALVASVKAVEVDPSEVPSGFSIRR
jgi:acylphosphatase